MMTTTLHVTPDDLVNLRFAYHPLFEIPLSYRVLLNPEFQSPHRRWVEDTYRALSGVDLPHLNALIIPRGYIPDFLMPTPITNGEGIEDNLKALLSTDDTLIRHDVGTLIRDAGETAVRMRFINHPRKALYALVEELRLYWQCALEPAWSRMSGVLEGDILYRGKLLALEGPHSLLEDLHPTIAFRENQIQVTLNSNHALCPPEVRLHGAGIQLVPTIFVGDGRMIRVKPELHPMIAYSARGAGLYNRETSTSKPLELVLGAGRARVLQLLTTPATTSEVAYMLRISSATASEHLSRLTNAGLTIPRRSGKRVFYQFTERGEHLVALFARGD
jgi:DNA-binding transcriptional ArsR family regulator